METKEDLIYTHTRLQTINSTVFIAVNNTESAVEIQKPMIILDNEKMRKETRLDISVKEYNILNDFFESLAGKELPVIDIDKLVVLTCYPIIPLEDETSFVSIIEYYDEGEGEVKDLLVLSDSEDGSEHSIEISEEVFLVLSKHGFTTIGG